jgi:hypothetical protein
MRLFKDVVDGFLYNLNAGSTVVFSLKIFKNPACVLNGFFIKVEQDEGGVIACFILNEEILDFSGWSTSKIEDFCHFVVAPRTPGFTYQKLC